MSIKVKPLKWTARNSDGNLVLSWDAFSPVLGYQVGRLIDRVGEEILYQGTFYEDITQAIAAAEADYQEKMMACLEIVPDAAPPQPNVADDYFASLVARARLAADKAARKFPQPNYVTLKIAEEAGEAVRAAVHYAEGRMQWDEVEGEIVQLLAMLIRFVSEGDQVLGALPPQRVTTKSEVRS